MQATKMCRIEILIDENYLRQSFPDLWYVIHGQLAFASPVTPGCQVSIEQLSRLE